MSPPDPGKPYHAGARGWQDRFDSRRLADRLAERLSRPSLSDEDRAFIATQRLCFLATADAQGRPDVSYKGGDPGFVQVLDARTLALPHWDGNGMFLSLGNVAVNAAVALLFIDLAQPRRLRVHGRASASTDDPLRGRWPLAQAVLRVQVERVFPNCPRYIHRWQLVEPSPYVPCAGSTPPVPAWKRFEMFRDVLPQGDPAR